LTTLTEITDRAENALDDSGNTYWTAALIKEWIAEAIRDYSIHFPRYATTTISAAFKVDDHTYTMPSDFLDAVQVEFPAGSDPKEFLTRLSETHPDFYNCDDYYDVRPWDQDSQPELVIGATIGSRSVTARYTVRHDETIGDSDDLTIPAHHEHLLILFVLWKAHQHRISKELQGPDTTIQLLNQFKAAAWEARDAYHQAVRKLEKRQLASGYTGPWRSDEHDRIY
jgi:hypothetical protein